MTEEQLRKKFYEELISIESWQDVLYDLVYESVQDLPIETVESYLGYQSKYTITLEVKHQDPIKDTYTIDKLIEDIENENCLVKITDMQTRYE